MRVGGHPHPAVLTLGLSQSESDEIRRLVPTLRVLAEGADLYGIRQAEWDCLVTRGYVPGNVATHICVLAVGDSLATDVRDLGSIAGGSSSLLACTRPHASSSTEFETWDDWPADICRLIQADLLPILQAERSHSVLTAYTAGFGTVSFAHESERLFKPFVSDGDGRPLSGSFRRHVAPGAGIAWWLPDGVRLAAWVGAALNLWREHAPTRFPTVGAWAERDEWMTPAERAAKLRMAQHEAEKSAWLRQHAIAAAAIEEEFLTAVKGSRIRRSLLDGQGDVLVASVIEAFQQLGFEVEDVDKSHADKSAKVEDLRVGDESGSWEALVEVRGYTGGAKSSDLMRIERFVGRYQLEKGFRPNAVWYVVNQLLGQDPSIRPKPLEANPEDVQAFAEGGGLIIDTRDLFRLANAVESQALAPKAARQLLVGSQGVFGFQL